MWHRVHPLARITAGMLAVSLIFLARPVLVGHPSGPWHAVMVDSFFGDPGRWMPTIFCVPAAVLSIGYRDAETPARIAVWGWGAVAAATLVLQLAQNALEALSSLGF